MKLSSAFLISFYYTVSALPTETFMDRYFGPLLNSNNNQAQIQGHLQHPFARYDPDNDGVQFHDAQVNIPSPDYVSDLGPDNMPEFAGVDGFAHLPIYQCFGLDPDAIKPSFDVAIVGAPFDTGVSYRGGARFGPKGIRSGSRRMGKFGSYSAFHNGFNPYDDWAKVVDCGDAPMTPFDNRIALNQLYRAHRAIHNLTVTNTSKAKELNTTTAPRIITLGGDHTITFSALRSAYEIHGPLAVVHFDSHIDTWDPQVLGGNISTYAHLNHGTFLHFAHEKGYLLDGHNIHVGLRAPYIRRKKDVEHDKECGFAKLSARDIDRIGVAAMARKIKEHVGDAKVYITFDIDVIDPAYAPGTGTTEPGGFSTREILTLLDELQGINLIGADVVEVAPAFDTNGDITVTAAAQVIDSFLQLMIMN
ncbi:uncharacterized protein SAPINGB_P001448 [Magnusiomyces paraingens]|uniref:Agmatinase n=1 Tax=Magnusiomyces paraingens TaxID=2606893 RepID=A0A5E8B6A5_9ASCO|nr:uncharacterized protein SAPINGB_P001448 [Saprochaete ingens]VVT46910.1 unnamed protein product [Saprochaete ingens]